MRSRWRSALAACALALVASPATAQAPPGNFYVGGNPAPDAWRFVMGPGGSANMSLMLARRTTTGAIGFSCRRAGGTMEMGFWMNGVRAEPGTEAEFMLSVGETSYPVRMRVRESSPSPSDPSVWEASGTAVTDVPSALALSPDSDFLGLGFTAPDGRAVGFGPVIPRDLAATAALVCDGWTRQRDDARVTTPSQTPTQPGAEQELVLPGVRR